MAEAIKDFFFKLGIFLFIIQTSLMPLMAWAIKRNKETWRVRLSTAWLLLGFLGMLCMMSKLLPILLELGR